MGDEVAIWTTRGSLLTYQTKAGWCNPSLPSVLTAFPPSPSARNKRRWSWYSKLILFKMAPLFPAVERNKTLTKRENGNDCRPQKIYFGGKQYTIAQVLKISQSRYWLLLQPGCTSHKLQNTKAPLLVGMCLGIFLLTNFYTQREQSFLYQDSTAFLHTRRQYTGFLAMCWLIIPLFTSVVSSIEVI